MSTLANMLSNRESLRSLVDRLTRPAGGVAWPSWFKARESSLFGGRELADPIAVCAECGRHYQEICVPCDTEARESAKADVLPMRRRAGR